MTSTLTNHKSTYIICLEDVSVFTFFPGYEILLLYQENLTRRLNKTISLQSSVSWMLFNVTKIFVDKTIKNV